MLQGDYKLKGELPDAGSCNLASISLDKRGKMGPPWGGGLMFQKMKLCMGGRNQVDRAQGESMQPRVMGFLGEPDSEEASNGQESEVCHLGKASRW